MSTSKKTYRSIAVTLFATILVLLIFAIGYQALDRDRNPASNISPGITHESLLYGRVTMDDGDIYEGPLRWGGNEEALWSHYFNGRKNKNPWVAHVPAELLPREQEGFLWNRPTDFSRPFMVRMGDLARIDAHGREFRVTLKSGLAFDLARFEADDLADGLRIWDNKHGVLDLGEWKISSIEFLPAPKSEATPSALHGTVHTRQGDFIGLIQWNREQSLGSDELVGESAEGPVRLRFESIRSIARHENENTLVTLQNGQEIMLTSTRTVNGNHRGIYVDDPRYGRVLVSWDILELIDFTPGGTTGPTYDDFPTGHPLKGTVITRSGHNITGRLVYDLDESETTETLDAPFQGVDYTIPFGHISSLVLPKGEQLINVTLQSGEELQLEPTGDLDQQNAGMLIFIDSSQPEYIPWADVEQITFDQPPVVYLPNNTP